MGKGYEILGREATVLEEGCRAKKYWWLQRLKPRPLMRWRRNFEEKVLLEKDCSREGMANLVSS